MSLVPCSSAEAELAQLIDRLDHWRQTRPTRRAPIPDWLWDQAVALTAHLPLSRVAKRLGLNRRDLKKRCGQSPPGPPPSVGPEPDFIEAKVAPSWLAAGMEIDLQRTDGARLRIHYREPQPPLAAVVQTFLETR
jgi:hypothetical protein